MTDDARALHDEAPDAHDDAAEADQLRVVHHHPGRLRLRSRALEGAPTPARIERAIHALRALAGILDIHAAARTGSLLVTYDPRLVGVAAIVDAVAHATGTTLGSGKPKPGDEDRFAYIAIDLVRETNAIVQELTHHRADLRVLVPAALAGLSLWSLAERGVRMPSWDNLLYWAYTVFLAVNEPEIRRGQTKQEQPA